MFIVLVVVITSFSKWSLRCQSERLNNAVKPGNPVRLRNVLRKALRGETLQMAVIGGSNSAGGGIEKDDSSLEGLYHNVFATWWAGNIEKKTGAGLQIQNLAVTGTGSEFFAFCYHTLIHTPSQVLDIVLVEQSVNFNKIGKAEPLEQLTRQLLAHPSTPAITFVNFFSGMGLNPSTRQVNNLRCTNLEDHGQPELERHYEITSVSLRDIICPVSESGARKIRESGMVTSGGIHFGSKAHDLLAQALISHVQKTLNDVTIGYSENSRETSVIPRPLWVTFPLTAPLCMTFLTPDISQMFQPTLATNVLRRDRFYFILTKAGKLRTDAIGGWLAKRVGSSIVFRVLVPQMGSLIILVHTFGKGGGEADVQVDRAVTKTKATSRLSADKYTVNVNKCE